MGGTGAWDLDVAIAEYEGLFGALEDDEPTGAAKGDQASQG